MDLAAAEAFQPSRSQQDESGAGSDRHRSLARNTLPCTRTRGSLHAEVATLRGERATRQGYRRCSSKHRTCAGLAMGREDAGAATRTRNAPGRYSQIEIANQREFLSGFRERAKSSDQTLSSATAIPCPTPMHMVASARFAPRRLSSSAAVPVIRAPLMPSG